MSKSKATVRHNKIQNNEFDSDFKNMVFYCNEYNILLRFLPNVLPLGKNLNTLHFSPVLLLYECI